MSSDPVSARLWFGEGLASSAARTLLAPAAAVFGTAVSARNRMFDAGLLRSHEAPIPIISIGNLTVGGTGKTPVAAYFVSRLLQRGAHPALLLRGYGRDEVEVHRILNPECKVLAGADRVRTARLAARVLGADVGVLDDGFQHRRLRRDVDIVLLSADAPVSKRRLLPSGPWREDLPALARATAVAITRKAAADSAVEPLLALTARHAPEAARLVVRLRHAELRTLEGDSKPLRALYGRKVLMIAAIGDPATFAIQLEEHGAIVNPARFQDHHEFTAAEVARLMEAARLADLAVCTLKDAVKLDALWSRADIPLWYVSQTVEVELGGNWLDAMLNSVVAVQQ